MNIMEFIKEIVWPVAVILGLIVIIIYRGPLGDLISNLRKGSVSNKKGEGFSMNLEVDPPFQGVKELLSDSELLEDQTPENIKREKSQAIQDKLPDTEINWVSLFFQRKYPEARQALLETISQNKDISPDDMLWFKGEAAQILSKYDYQKGKEEFEELISKNPETTLLYLQYFDVLSQTGDWNRAFSLIDKYPGNISNKYTLLFQKAKILIKKPDNQDALQIIDELISQNENVLIKARAHILKGLVLKKQEKPDDAKNWFYKAFRILPTDDSVLREIAEAFSEMSDAKSSLFFRRQLANLHANEAAHWGYMGNAFLALDLENRAMEAYEKANQLASGEETWLMANIGNLYNNVGLYNKAIEFLQKAIEKDSKNQYSHERLAFALTNKEKEDTKVNQILEEIKDLIEKLD